MPNRRLAKGQSSDMFVVSHAVECVKLILAKAGKIHSVHWSSGLEERVSGHRRNIIEQADYWQAIFLLTRFGDSPMPADEVRVYVAHVRQELNKKNIHMPLYVYTKGSEEAALTLQSAPWGPEASVACL